MRTINVHCDHCGKQLNEKKPFNDIEIDFGRKPLIDADLCKECQDELYNMVLRFLGDTTRF